MRYTIVAAGIALLSGLTYAQQGVIFSVLDPRPLNEAAQRFELLYGIPISYEDPEYSWQGELGDNTPPVYAKNHPNGLRGLFLKGTRQLDLVGDPHQAVHSAADATPMLQSLVDDHHKRGYPGEFKLIPNGDGLDIVPVGVKDSHGIQIPHQSPLDTRISLPEMKRNANETMYAICQAVRTNSGKMVDLGASPFTGMQPYSVTIGASNEAARSVLQRALAGLQFADGAKSKMPKIAWSLLYDPGPKLYFLNLRQVFKEIPTPSGGKTKRLVFR